MAENMLVKKLAEVMQEVKYIQKTGYNNFHKYRYATEADVNEKVREELAKRNVILIPNVKSHSVRTHTTAKGNTEYIVTVEVEFIFMDGETGEMISFTTFGEGQDAGDKGTYKAITGAQKYALMKSFMIPTGDDPEADEGTDEKNHRPTGAPPKQDIPPASLKTKYSTFKGNMEGFEDWVKSMQDKGHNYKSMEALLEKGLRERAQQKEEA